MGSLSAPDRQVTPNLHRRRRGAEETQRKDNIKPGGSNARCPGTVIANPYRFLMEKYSLLRQRVMQAGLSGDETLREPQCGNR
jgi:hypothetical protein